MIFKIIYSLLLLSGMLFSSAINSKNYVSDDRLPSIDKEKLNDIVNNTKLTKEEIYIYKNIKEKNKKRIKAKKIAKRKRLMYSLDALLREINSISKKTNTSLNPIYLSKDKDFIVYLTKKEYKKILNSKNIDDFLYKINNILNTNLSYKKVNFGKNVFYVGNYVDKALDILKNKKYISVISKKNKQGLSKLERAFEYFKNYKNEKNKMKSFNLSVIEILNLYNRILRWNVDISTSNKILLGMFKAKAQYLHNFYFVSAYRDLKNNPSIKVIQDIKESLLTILDLKKENTTHYKKREKFTLKSSIKFSNLLKKISKTEEGEYILSSFSINPIVSIDIDDNLPINSFYTLQSRIIKDSKTSTLYEMKILTNKYIKNAKKEVVLYEKKYGLNQARHYLDKAILEAYKNSDKDFARNVFKEEINEIKKGIR